ncbi:iron uptake system protein EfeO [Planctomonas deserti]|uniref:iron uptake system protein EfeO n=1 Tax=Planctomonas deserti TaxID=2144185 RepID=UPI000D37A5F2|nr:iron uptake system protein EfeO [Planctomonas deserti]
MSPRPSALTVAAVLCVLPLTACTANAPAGGDASAPLAVTSSADDCTVDAAEAPSGPLSFSVSNDTDQVTEFYLLAEDGLRIVGEVENIGPGITRTLTVQARPGEYFTVCKPGMVGDGVGRKAFTVTDSGAEIQLTGDLEAQGEKAAAEYVAYVKDQVGQLVTATRSFADAYRAGDDDTARSLYAPSRAHYERIEPIAESFGDLDPKLDFREADVPEGDEWTGWHRIEKDLWPPAAAENGGAEYTPLSAADRARFADLLVADTQGLYDAVHDEAFEVPIDSISNGAVGLLDEVASGKITGEEEIWSHTDLWDFQANLEGARVAFDGVRPIVEQKDGELATRLDARFAALERQLSAYGSLESGFASYTDLSTAQVKELADGVNALAEPLSTLTAVLVG